MKTYHGYVRFSTLIDEFLFRAKEEDAEEYMYITSRIEYETYRKLFDCPTYEDSIAELARLEYNGNYNMVPEDRAEDYYNDIINSFVEYWFEEVKE